MGIRLYPNTTDRAAVEQIAGVPAGTYDRLDAMEAAHEAEKAVRRADGTWSESVDGYRQWGEINDDDALAALSGMLVFGWGKFSDRHGFAPDYAGRLGADKADLDKVATLFRDNGIVADPALCQGVHWC